MPPTVASTPSRASSAPDALDRRITTRLREVRGPISGQALARDLGISRVALWKRIQALEAWGYGIEASRKGYQLVRDDGIAAWELAAPGPVMLFDETASTMNDARRAAEAGAVNGTLTLALRQNAGRDRTGGTWESPAGGLYFSVVLRSPLPLSHSGALLLESARTVLDLLGKAGIEGLRFDWPSGISTARRDGICRIGGLLVESGGSILRADYRVVGVGLNVAKLDVPGRSVAALADLTETPPRRAMLAADFARTMASWALEPRLEPERWAGLIPRSGAGLRVRLWNGTERILNPIGFNERGDLIDASGGPALSPGECLTLRPIGVSS